MYKKSIVLLALLSTSAHYASEVTPWLELKPSYFLFNASPMKNVYDNGGFEIQGSATVPVCNWLGVYGSVGYRKAHGRALNTGDKTTLSVIPVDIGLKPIFAIGECLYYFFAMGPRYIHIEQRNCSPYVDPRLSANGIGFFVNTGLNIILSRHLLCGIFAEYSYEKKAVCPSKPYVYSNGSVQMGGFAFGASVGCAF